MGRKKTKVTKATQSASVENTDTQQQQGVTEVTNSDKEGGSLLGGTLVPKSEGGGNTRYVMLSGFVGGWRVNLENLKWQTSGVTENDTVVFFLNSGGGSVLEGLAMLNYIKLLPCKTIALVAYAASMMTQIALACDEVHAFEQSIFMIHNAQGIAYGDNRVMEKQANLLSKINKMMAYSYAKTTGKTNDEILTMMDADTYLFGKEIVDVGFAHSVLETSSDDALLELTDEGVDVANVTIVENEEDASAMVTDGVLAMFDDVRQGDYIESLEAGIVACSGDCDPSADLGSGNSLTDLVTDADKMTVSENKKEIVLKTENGNETVTTTTDAPQNTEVAMSTAVAEALTAERGRVSAIMAVDGVSAYLGNSDISAMMADGVSTANDVKAKMYDILLADTTTQTDRVKSDSATASTDMASIEADAGTANPDDEIESLLTEDEITAIDEAMIVAV